ncbi:LPS sulfotransferase NodH [Roseovarius azorensis]|uniref:LPS sulfotransferase NodH n=1 Tax=Roseovarius azorensis TaxID=1287727 RepID=A0A1H7KNH6_9RHOB|nr:Stf0 family sulfotransferase [Roseovarius azorensis]SEK88070.1 LPS sulfotransferase NodH [Roseovarius azorensis]
MKAAPETETNCLQVTIPENLWQRQFEVANDFPPTPVIHRVAICTTPRCGSHFLGHQMRALNCFGYPLEYLNPGNWPIWEARARSSGAADTFHFIKSVRTGPNGVFSIKLHHEHLEAFVEREFDPLSYRFIHLRRRDLVRQAVSFARAQQTGAWISDMPERAKARYDRKLIAAKLDAIAEWNAGWTSFLVSLGVQPLELFYEDVVADREGAMRRIATYLGIELPEVSTCEDVFQPKAQRASDDPTEVWVARFTAENRGAIGRYQPVPGYRHTPKMRRLGNGVRRNVSSALRRIVVGS